MIYKRYLVGAALLLNCFSCLETDIQQNKTMKFFDLKGFIGNEIKTRTGHLNATKDITVNGKKESQVMKSNYDLSTDLSIFLESDINKPTWSDAYKVDSVFNSNGELNAIVYNALDDQLRTKLLSVSFENDEVEEINITNKKSNVIVESEQLMRYNPSKGYKINSNQHVIFSNKEKVEIEVQFQ